MPDEAYVWWVFQMPHGLAHVPGATEEAARAAHRRHCYEGAPVDAWPLVSMRLASRDVLAEDLTRRVFP